MIGSPGKESPVGSVPEPTKKENDKCVANNLKFGAATAAHGDIYIIAEPSRK